MNKLVVVLGFLFLSGSVFAQSSTDIVWEQLQDAYSDASEEGYSVKNYLIGGLEHEEDATWQFYLYSGNTYEIIGVCDHDCSDVDLYLSDEDESNDELLSWYKTPRHPQRHNTIFQNLQEKGRAALKGVIKLRRSTSGVSYIVLSLLFIC